MDLRTYAVDESENNRLGERARSIQWHNGVHWGPCEKLKELPRVLRAEDSEVGIVPFLALYRRCTSRHRLGGL